MTDKESEYQFPEWSQAHQAAFNGIKNLVASSDCLTTIDHSKMPEFRVFVTTDASDYQSGAMLSFGKTWESSRPVAFDSKPFKNAELNYPVHEKELFAIIRALDKWRADLLGIPFTVLTDHRTLECFQTQKHLSRRQARWTESLQQYDFDIVYIKGGDNTVADALSRTTFDNAQQEIDCWRMTNFDVLDELDVPVCSLLTPSDSSPFSTTQSLASVPNESIVAPIMEITHDDELLSSIIDGYTSDSWCRKALDTKMDGLELRNRLLYYKGRLVIPRTNNLPHTLASLAHNALGHFGFDKTYAAMRETFYWPGMRTFLEHSYIPSCDLCQRMKAPTTRPVGPLHPLPIPDRRFSSVAIDFVGPFPEENGCDHILTMTDRLGADIRLVPCKTNLSARELASIFFDHWFCENGLPDDIVSDRGVLFLSRFWKHLHELTGVTLKMSTAFHPQTDGVSERTNKTLNQALRMAVDKHHTGWVSALPRIRFTMMNNINASTGYSGFFLRLGMSPRLIPPIAKDPIEENTETPLQFVERLALDVGTASDNLFDAKVNQSAQANRLRLPDLPYSVGDKVLLSTKNLSLDEHGDLLPPTRKLRPKFVGPFTILLVDSAHSTATLDVPGPINKCRIFHFSLLKPYNALVEELPPCEPQVTPDTDDHSRPPSPPKKSTKSGTEHFIRDLIAHEKSGRGWRFLVRWQGFSDDHNEWMTFSSLKHTLALDEYLAKHGPLT